MIWVKKGLLRNTKGKEHIYMFAPEDEINNLYFRVLKIPTVLFVDTLEDSESLEIDTAFDITSEMHIQFQFSTFLS